ncbi:hypothetical protein [Sandaracinus amylolyticus]|uniref:SGNH hydrolase-type esterase domain-containing protein n=1 Tax=Sandaracinus amylolyticus TaxID=927083 RepID=A0A0F6SE50_9BACT|nr:hypothetical protein [Sandaracinus amylolyticus]AKF04579.1 hypothetical protein DB32_001728 [Sandaracinus amylolyticus]
MPHRSRLALALSSLALVLVVLASPAAARLRAGIPRAQPIHVLFIGNSYTRSNNLPYMVRRIAETIPDTAPFRVTKIANPGWDLQRHWYVDETRHALAQGGFTHVVLQGHSLTALQHRDEFEGYARLFDGEIDRIGARSVLFETWARSPRSGAYRRRRDVPHIAESPVDMQARVSECYLQLARDIDADLAPAGRAFLLAQQRLRDPDLYRSDGAHPSPNGTFLAAAVLYATIAHDDPRRSPWRPHRMSRDLAEELRDIAYISVTNGH